MTRERLDEAKALSLELLVAANNFAFLAWHAVPRAWRVPGFVLQKKPKELLRSMNRRVDEIEVLHGKWRRALDVVRPLLLATNASREPVTVLEVTFPIAHEAVWEVARRALSMGEQVDALAPYPDTSQLVSRIELEHASAIATLKEPVNELSGKDGAPLVDLEKAKKKWVSVRDAPNRPTRGRVLRGKGLDTEGGKWVDPHRKYPELWRD